MTWKSWLIKSVFYSQVWNRRERQKQKKKSCHKRSSLDLGASLLDIYDDIIAQHEDASTDISSSTPPCSLTAPSSPPHPPSPLSLSPSGRTGRLPSQDSPSDRPVSLMYPSHPADHAHSDHAHHRKRPLSISSMSSASSSSLPGSRKKRSTDLAPCDTADSRDTGIPDEEDEREIDEGDDHSDPAQSRHSVDSGCVDADRHTDLEKQLDSRTSRPQHLLDNRVLLRDEMDSKSSSNTTTERPTPSSPHLLQHTSSPSPYRTYTQDKPTSDILASLHDAPTTPINTRLTRPRKLSTPLSPNIAKRSDGSAGGSSPSAPLSPTSFSSSNHEARKRFFTNYEAHFNQSLGGHGEPATPPHSDLDSPKGLTNGGNGSPRSPSSPTQTVDSSPKSPKSKQSFHLPSFSPPSRDRKLSSGGGASQRSMFSRTSKKRDHAHPGGQESGSKSPVYVSYVQRVVAEIVDSERTYIASLEDIITGYLEPMEKTLDTPRGQNDVKCLFSNIRDIYSFGCNFLADLEVAGSDPVNVAECFVRHNKGFVIYSDYCTNYPQAVEVLTRFMQDPDLSQLCKGRQLALGHGLPLGAFLLRPVQRILKYHLLLGNIVKNYEVGSGPPGHTAVLESAFQHMTQMAEHINEMKRRHEHAVRIQEIQSQLEDYVGEDLTRLGELVLESTFRVYGAKASRQVFLFEKGLLISKKKEGGMLSCKTFIRCSNLMLVEVIPNEPLSFHVIPFDNPRAQYTLQARNMEQKRRWCQEVKRLILESFKGRIPDNVKSLVMKLGREHDDDLVTKEKMEAVRKTQHTAPEYLEKKKEKETRNRKKSKSRIPDFILLKPQRGKKDWNKKGDKVKVSPETTRRAASKSPDSSRRIFSKQLGQTKRRSQSQCTTPTTEAVDFITGEPLPSNQTGPLKQPANQSQSVEQTSNLQVPANQEGIQNNGALSAIIASGLASFAATMSEGGDLNVNNSSNSRPGDLLFGRMGSNDRVLRRPDSFRKAMESPPMSSQDLSELVTRCGGSLKFSTPNKVPGLSESEMSLGDIGRGLSEEGRSLTNLSGYSLCSNAEDSSDDETGTTTGASRSEISTFELSTMSLESSCTADEDGSDRKFISSRDISAIDEGTDDILASGTMSASLPSLHTGDIPATDAASVDVASRVRLDTHPNHSNSEIGISSKVGGRMSRRDLQNASNINNRIAKRAGIPFDNGSEAPHERKVTAFYDTYSSRVAEKGGLHKNLRVSNSTQHLTGPCSNSGSQLKATLTDWNSLEKLTKGSLTDLSHLDEDPWEVKLTSPTSERKKQMSDKIGNAYVNQAYQDTPSKDNLDWIVYLNRNSLDSNLYNSLSPKQRKSTSQLDRGVVRKEHLDLLPSRRVSSQVPYATPPRSYMTQENMNKFGSGKYLSSSDQSTINIVPVSSPPASSVGPARPTTLHHFGRSQSEKFGSRSQPSSLCNTPPNRHRPLSMDIERITEESDRMLAEMEEYIRAQEQAQSPGKFPTSLHSIADAEEDGTCASRLSAGSNVSSSSYDSQSSSTTSGDNTNSVGRSSGEVQWPAWANRAETSLPRDKSLDDVVSLASTLTPDDSEQPVPSIEVLPPAKSGNTFEAPAPNTCESWTTSRQLESVLREHSLGGALIGSRMAAPAGSESPRLSPRESRPHIDTQLTELTQLCLQDDTDPRPHSACLYTDTTDGHLAVKEQSPDQPARFSLPPTSEAAEALMPLSLQNCDIQQSDSGFSLQSTDSSLSETPGVPKPDQQETTTDQSDPSIPKDSPTTPSRSSPAPKAKSQSRPSGGRQRPSKLTDSCESIDSMDSFYERRLSVALDADVFNTENPVIVTVYEEKSHSRLLSDPSSPTPESKQRSIRDVVQSIERKMASQGPEVVQVRRKEPSTTIQQKLDTLRENLVHGRRSSRGSSRRGSEEREGTRSLSCNARTMGGSHVGLRSNDNISVHGIKSTPKDVVVSMSRERKDGAMCRERVSSVDSNRGGRESVTGPVVSRESVSLVVSDCSDYKPTSSPTFTPILSVRNNRPGHESDGSRFLFLSGGQPLPGNQFVFRARSNSEQTHTEGEEDGEEGMGLGSKSLCKLDQLSSEIDNLVIMKGWVRNLVSKFQNT